MSSAARCSRVRRRYFLGCGAGPTGLLEELSKLRAIPMPAKYPTCRGSMGSLLSNVGLNPTVEAQKLET